MSERTDSRGTMLGAYSAWAAAQVPEEPGPLSLRNPRWSAVDQWRKEARAKVSELLACPEEASPRVRTLSVSSFEGLRIEELSWQLPYGPETRAVLLKPENAKGRLPGVLALHDHGGVKCYGYRKIVRTGASAHPFLAEFQQTYYGGAAWANELARRGYAVLAHDVFAFGSRRILAADLPPHVTARMLQDPLAPRTLAPDELRHWVSGLRVDISPAETPEEIAAYNAFAYAHESIVAKSLFSAGASWPGLDLADDRAALGILASRDDVDPERLGCCGLSGGGLRADYLAGMDDRIRCAVSVGFMTTWRDFVVDVSHTHTWMIYVPHLARFLDFPEILGLRAPLPSLVLITTEDPLFSPGEVRRSEEMLRDVYRKAGAAGAFRFSRHPGPHKFDLPMQREAFEWFDGWLRP